LSKFQRNVNSLGSRRRYKRSSYFFIFLVTFVSHFSIPHSYLCHFLTVHFNSSFLTGSLLKLCDPSLSIAFRSSVHYAYISCVRPVIFPILRFLILIKSERWFAYIYIYIFLFCSYFVSTPQHPTLKIKMLCALLPTVPVTAPSHKYSK
jgi:hypothetical protein